MTENELLNGMVGYADIDKEAHLFNQLKAQIDDFYVQAKQKYHLQIRKIQTEKKLMSLNLGTMKLNIGQNNNTSVDKEVVEFDAIKL